MAAPKKKKEAPKVKAPEPEPVYQICGTCKHWQVKNGWPHAGECMPSRAVGAQPIVTLDLDACRGWKWMHDA